MIQLKAILAAALIALSMNHAQANVPVDFQALQNHALVEASLTAGLRWTVGDKAGYKMANAILNGTSQTFIREETATGFWMQQDMDLGFMGKQKIEVLFNKSTGQIEKILANGKEQELPTAADVEIVETKEAKVTAMGREFDCIYAKIKDKKNNQIQEAWLNPQEVPISGMIKTVSDSQFGKITQELTSFEFGPGRK